MIEQAHSQPVTVVAAVPQPQTMLAQPMMQQQMVQQQRPAEECGDCGSCLICFCCGGCCGICGIAAWVHDCNVRDLNRYGHFELAHKKAADASQCRMMGVVCALVMLALNMFLRSSMTGGGYGGGYGG